MSPATKARVDAGAALGRKLSEYAHANVLFGRGHCTHAYVEAKLAEYKHALDVVIAAAQAEGCEEGR